MIDSMLREALEGVETLADIVQRVTAMIYQPCGLEGKQVLVTRAGGDHASGELVRVQGNIAVLLHPSAVHVFTSIEEVPNAQDCE